MVLLAGVANVYGAVRKGKDITYPVVGGFIVLILLLAVAEVNGRIAELFAGAYTITSMLTNGAELVTAVTTFVNPSSPRFDPGGQQQTAGGAAAPATFATAAAAPPGATVIPAPTYSPTAPTTRITPVSLPSAPARITYI